MDNATMMKHVDHTILKATAAWADIQKLCDEAVRHGTASVCIPPSYVSRVRDSYGDSLNICTVIGFPLGYSTPETKAFETGRAIEDGATEIDMVVNLGDVKNGDFDKITDEIALVKRATGERVLKVIIETCYLTEDEKITLCKCVTEGGADYIKTSTGFGTGGAELPDIRLFKEHIGGNIKIKASGGIKTREALEMFLSEGCERIGTSSAVSMLNAL